MTYAAMVEKVLERTPADRQVVETIAQSLWQDDGSGVMFTAAHVRTVIEYLGRMNRARVV